MEQWYTLYTKPNAEYQVAAALRGRRLEIYLPEIKNQKSFQGYKSKPFFPCYLFLKVDFEIVGLSDVQWTPGLRRIVTFGSWPVPLPDKVIDLIRGRLGESETDDGRPVYTFEPGDRVSFKDGPFRDMEAVFEGSMTANQRVQVLLDILGHARRIQVDVANLKEIPLGVSTPRPKRPRRTRGRGRRIR